jgi:two-component system alkaline phosphatase synthesis response regulator PhoP
MKKILVVEDELAYLKLLNSQLTQKGYKVIEAINGKNGLAKAKSENPDLILLDIRMPVMDGMAMLSLLRKEEQGDEHEVIF